MEKNLVKNWDCWEFKGQLDTLLQYSIHYDVMKDLRG